MTSNQLRDKKSFIYTITPKINNIASKLDNNVVRFLTYVRQYDDGRCANLTTRSDWLFHWINDGYLHADIQYKRLKNGINYWRRHSSDNICLIAEDARNNFDIDARIEFVYRDDFNSCFHSYSFCSDRRNLNKAYQFYDSHRSKLLKFIAYFNQEINKQGILLAATSLHNLYIVPQYRALKNAIANLKRDYLSELKQEDASVELEDREFEVMLLWSQGCTVKQIAKMLGRSSKTIESYIYHAKNKLNFNDRASMNAYFREKNWNWLVDFFLPYIPQVPV